MERHAPWSPAFAAAYRHRAAVEVKIAELHITGRLHPQARIDQQRRIATSRSRSRSSRSARTARSIAQQGWAERALVCLLPPRSKLAEVAACGADHRW